MPDNADIYWDDHDQPDNLTPPASDDGDFFEVRTFDTGDLERARKGRSGTSHYPTIPVLSEEDITPEDAEISAFTVEPPRDARLIRVSEQRVPARQQARPQSQAPLRSRRRGRRQDIQQPPGVWWTTLRTFFIVLAAAVLVSTIFSLRPMNPTDEFRAELNSVQATQPEIYIRPSPLPTEARQVRIGIIAGHTGPPLREDLPEDPGAVCPDGLTERRINSAIAQEIVAALRRDQYTVDLLEEFDPRLDGYQADVLVSIHTNDCQDYGAAGTGYNAASAMARQTTRGQDERLLACLIEQYGATTGLPQHQALTYDMTEYHTFSEVAVDTPTAIIEIGFMLNDRPILLNQQPLVAQGIANGIRCFLRPDLYGDVTVP